MRDLVRHLAEIHLWAAARVAKRTEKLWLEDLSELTDSWPDLAKFWPEDADLVDWYLETNANLVRSLQSAPADLECPTFLPAPSPLAMWARRQAHETAVHRFDAENATEIAADFDPVFAADGIDELLVGFAPRRPEFPIDRDQTMHIHTADTDDYWQMTLKPNGITTTRSNGSAADLTLEGTASDLYLVLWNRGEDSRIGATGNIELLDAWHGNHRVRWS